MKRKEIKARTIQQNNDSDCIGDGNDASNTRNKSAKRLASRRQRKIIREEIKDYLNGMDEDDDTFPV